MQKIFLWYSGFKSCANIKLHPFRNKKCSCEKPLDMNWRTQRQIFSLLFVIIILIGIFGYFVFPKLSPIPTCTDNRKNQGEFDVDCGGPCAPCELRNAKPVEIFWARMVSVRKNSYDAAAYIQNSNTLLSSVKLEYEFTLFDDLGLVARKTGTTFIYPQEDLYVIEANITTSREPRRVKFKVTNVVWQFKQELRPNVAIEKREYRVVAENSSRQGIIETTVLNRSPYDFREVEVRVVALDSDENLLGVDKLIADDFLSGSSRVVKSIWPQEFIREVVTIQATARINIFDPTIIIKPH